MMKMLMLCMALGFAAGAWAQEEAYVVRETELKAKPYSDAQTLFMLPARSKVIVLQRRASWNQVKSGTTTGWVKMLSLQLARGAAQHRSDSGLRSLFNVARTGGSGATVTTGVRGLSEEQLTHAQPNPEALDALERYASDRRAAERFAAQGKLQAQRVDYLAGEKK